MLELRHLKLHEPQPHTRASCALVFHSMYSLYNPEINLVGEAKAGRSGCPGGCASEKGVTEGTPDTNMKKGKETPSKVQWVQVRGKEL